MCPEKAKEFEKICSSRRTVTRRVEDLNDDVCTTLSERIRSVQAFSMACGERTDAANTAQPGIFFREIDNKC